MLRVLAVVATGATLVVPAAATAASLPSVSSGERPGPPLLYAEAPNAPELSVKAPFSAAPLLISGSEAYRDGEYLYQDYLFDDRGADTVPLRGSRNSDDPAGDVAASTGGDVLYPTAARFGGNAADLAELRIKPTPDAIVYRLTLTTAKDRETAIAGIGIDTDRAGGAPVAWPLGAGVSSPGLDRFITAWGTGGEVRDLGTGVATPLPAGAVELDPRTNQMTIRVPRALPGMDSGSSTWRYVAGTGLHDGDGRWLDVPAGRAAGAQTPASGSALEGAPAVFNLAFRFDEPQTKTAAPPFTTFPGVGNWFEDKQSIALGAATTDCSFPGAAAGCKPFSVDVDFAKLAAGADEQLRRRPGREQARILASSAGVPEGVHDEFPAYGGRLQPYLLTVPPGYSGSRPAGLTFSLHSLGGTYTQFGTFSPNQLRQFGDQRGNLVATPLGRGTDGWYTDEAEADFFEVWADVARRFALDSERVALSGYSMGGYGTYKLGTQYPDLFGRAFTTVGPPGRGVWIPPAGPPSGGADTNSNPVLENARWIPFMNWVEAADDLVPYVGPRAQQARFDALGLRSTLWTFGPGEHFTLAILDGWAAARDFLGQARVKRDPSRVNYAFIPAADRVRLGLRHDHAYWVSDLRVRDASGDPATDPARGEIDARSLAIGEGDPNTGRVLSADPAAGPSQANLIEGTEWTAATRVSSENTLETRLDNVGAATIDGRRARLSGDAPLRIKLTSDGGGRLRLSMPLPAGATVERVEGGPVAIAAGTSGASRAAARAAQADAGAGAPEVDLSESGAEFAIASGTRAYVIRPAAAGTGADDDPGGPSGPGGGGDDDAGAAAGSGGSSEDGGSLPFTGLGLALLVVLGALLLSSGVGLRAARLR